MLLMMESSTEQDRNAQTMRGNIVFGIVVFVLFLTVSAKCFAQAQEPTGVSEIKKQFKGILLDEKRKKPIIGATVILISQDVYTMRSNGAGFVQTDDDDFYILSGNKWIKANIAKTKTNNSGVYFFTEIPQGEYVLGVKVKKPCALGFEGIPIDPRKNELAKDRLPVKVVIDSSSPIITDLGNMIMFLVPCR